MKQRYFDAKSGKEKKSSARPMPPVERQQISPPVSGASLAPPAQTRPWQPPAPGAKPAPSPIGPPTPQPKTPPPPPIGGVVNPPGVGGDGGGKGGGTEKGPTLGGVIGTGSALPNNTISRPAPPPSGPPQGGQDLPSAPGGRLFDGKPKKHYDAKVKVQHPQATKRIQMFGGKEGKDPAEGESHPTGNQFRAPKPKGAMPVKAGAGPKASNPFSKKFDASPGSQGSYQHQDALEDGDGVSDKGVNGRRSER